MKTVHVCFLWHMHQPYYTDPVAGSASLPWVRLHATKAYYDMAYLLERFPSVHATFNFTPSLLRQLTEISAGTVRDLFLEHARRPAADLSLEEKAFILRHFFAANWATMVRPYPRYHELLIKRGLDVSADDLPRLARQFSRQEMLDLQVWHNLAWFGFGAVRREPRLAALRNKSRSFTEDEKHEVLARQQLAVKEIVPLYRSLFERGQVELTTTPFFHPILPLVIDTDINRRARPDLPLPSRLRAPEDAQAQLNRAARLHHETFGQPPAGLWPSEGSVCPELVPLAQRAGFTWFATDEGVLARSLAASGRHWHRQQHLYRPYRTGNSGQELTIVFRDRELSDAFGFIYHKTTPESAAEDVLRRLRGIMHETNQEHVLIPIILDGENPWEHYHDGGEQFLSRLYEAFASRGLDGPDTRVQAVTMSEALAAAPPAEHLPTLHSGSWINQDFKIWIGHHEDNRAWDLLGHTRARLTETASGLPPGRAAAAWDELYAAEGSDWFWWYGDDFDTDLKPEFDRLFRMHLRNVWFHMGVAAPEDLNQPICPPRQAFRDLVEPPRGLLTPTIDGSVTDFFEWRSAGIIETQPPLGAMWKADKLFTAIRFGWNRDELFLRLDPDENARSRASSLIVTVMLQGPKHAFRLSFPLGAPDSYALAQAREGRPWEDVGTSRAIACGKILELAAPWKDLHLEPGQEIGLSITVSEQGLEIARYPSHQTAALTRPGEDFEAALWRV